MQSNSLNINGIIITDTGFPELLSVIDKSIVNNKQTAIAYANANSINLSYKYPVLIRSLEQFDMIHPDGTGVRLAARILNKPFGSNHRFTGSDFYPLLINNSIKNKHSYYFFGHDNETLSRISAIYPDLIISGVHSGFNFSDDEVIDDINSHSADILIIGLGTPLQENWTAKYRGKLNSKIIICVGEGIKVFAGNKKRGPVFLRVLGLEWLWRYFTNPFKYFGRYIIGNPLFLYRIISIKMRKLAE